MKLYKPVGQKEYELIKQSGFKEFPQMLEMQSIFYPALFKEYARKIAKEWNTKDELSGYIGHVMEFEIDDKFIAKYEMHIIEDNTYQIYRIPVEDLNVFNKSIVKKKHGLAIYAIDKFFSEYLLKEELKNTFFLSKVQLKGSCYHEFKPGHWGREHWSEESIYLRDDDIFIFALIFAKTLKKYDPYFGQEVNDVETSKLINIFTKFYESLIKSNNVIKTYQDIGIYEMISDDKLEKLMLIDCKNIIDEYNDVIVHGIYMPNELEKQLLEIDIEKLLKTTKYFLDWLQKSFTEYGCFTLLGI